MAHQLQYVSVNQIANFEAFTAMPYATNDDIKGPPLYPVVSVGNPASVNMQVEDAPPRTTFTTSTKPSANKKAIAKRQRRRAKALEKPHFCK